MDEVLVRCETPMLGLAWRAEVRLTRTQLIDNLIAAGRFTVLAEYPADGGDEAGSRDDDAAGPVGVSLPAAWVAVDPGN